VISRLTGTIPPPSHRVGSAIDPNCHASLQFSTWVVTEHGEAPQRVGGVRRAEGAFRTRHGGRERLETCLRSPCHANHQHLFACPGDQKRKNPSTAMRRVVRSSAPLRIMTCSRTTLASLWHTWLRRKPVTHSNLPRARRHPAMLRPVNSARFDSSTTARSAQGRTRLRVLSLQHKIGLCRQSYAIGRMLAPGQTSQSIPCRGQCPV